MVGLGVQEGKKAGRDYVIAKQKPRDKEA